MIHASSRWHDVHIWRTLRSSTRSPTHSIAACFSVLTCWVVMYRIRPLPIRCAVQRLLWFEVLEIVRVVAHDGSVSKKHTSELLNKQKHAEQKLNGIFYQLITNHSAQTIWPPLCVQTTEIYLINCCYCRMNLLCNSVGLSNIADSLTIIHYQFEFRICHFFPANTITHTSQNQLQLLRLMPVNAMLWYWYLSFSLAFLMRSTFLTPLFTLNDKSLNPFRNEIYSSPDHEETKRNEANKTETGKRASINS